MSSPDRSPQGQAETPEMTTARNKVRRRRSIALGLALLAFALAFYALTIVKMGPALFDRSL